MVAFLQNAFDNDTSVITIELHERFLKSEIIERKKSIIAWTVVRTSPVLASHLSFLYCGANQQCTILSLADIRRSE